MSTASPHHIIAIGASAGGMEEINTFFDHTCLKTKGKLMSNIVPKSTILYGDLLTHSEGLWGHQLICVKTLMASR